MPKPILTLVPIEQNFPIPGFIVKLNSEYGITDYDGEVTFDKQNIDKIKLLFLSFDEEIEIIKNDKERIKIRWSVYFL